MSAIDLVNFIKSNYPNQDFVPLHEPRFFGNEKKYLNECIDSTFVSSVGKFVNDVETKFAEFIGAKYAVACVNGTAALHMSLLLAGVEQGDLVITQPLSFIATCNAISYTDAEPIFVDIEQESLGLDPEKLEQYLRLHTTVNAEGKCMHNESKRVIKACVPMHTFGHPCKLDELVNICSKNKITLIEDAAEAIGSYYKGKHVGTFGKVSAFSFNGNKTITCGGGGILVTNDEALANKAKHLTTQAKKPHRWDFDHDHIGYNYRMPNLNAALLIAQLEQLNGFLENKRATATKYLNFFKGTEVQFAAEPENTKSNYWLCSALLPDNEQLLAYLQHTNDNGVMTRPAWKPMHEIEMFKHALRGDLSVTENIASRLISLPSSVTI